MIPSPAARTHRNQAVPRRGSPASNLSATSDQAHLNKSDDQGERGQREEQQMDGEQLVPAVGEDVRVLVHAVGEAAEPEQLTAEGAACGGHARPHQERERQDQRDQVRTAVGVAGELGLFVVGVEEQAGDGCEGQQQGDRYRRDDESSPEQGARAGGDLRGGSRVRVMVFSFPMSGRRVHRRDAT